MQRKYLTRPQAEVHLKERGLPTTKGTLQKYASVGGGPIYRIFGNRAVYTADDLDAWAEEKLSAPRRSTSELA
jgi:hypothetical protein